MSTSEFFGLIQMGPSALPDMGLLGLLKLRRCCSEEKKKIFRLASSWFAVILQQGRTKYTNVCLALRAGHYKMISVFQSHRNAFGFRNIKTNLWYLDIRYKLYFEVHWSAFGFIKFGNPWDKSFALAIVGARMTVMISDDRWYVEASYV